MYLAEAYVDAPIQYKGGHVTQPKVINTIAGCFRMQNGDIGVGVFAVLVNSLPESEKEDSKLIKTLISHLNKLFSA